MEFVIHPKIRYAHLAQAARAQRAALEDTLRSISSSHVVHPALGVYGEPFEPRPCTEIAGALFLLRATLQNTLRAPHAGGARAERRA
jgi:hypothetical protein